MTPNQDDARQYLVDWITVGVRGGFTPEDELLEDLEERVEDDYGEHAPELVAELRAFAVHLLAEQRREEEGWQNFTTNDAIDAAFAELRERGIVALQNAGYTMSQGWEDANEEAHTVFSSPRGAVFYHGQDLEDAVEGRGLYLAFGAYEEDDARHEAASLAIAREVVDTLTRHGVATDWDGTVERRLHILPFAWRKRRWTGAPAEPEPR